MKAVSLVIRLNSLYSIRIPYTWQSALTYPIPPPSAIIGMLANALQRYQKDDSPLKYLDKMEDEIIWAGARLLSAAVIKSYTTSAITNWKIKMGGKSTNALGRQYGFTRNIEILAVLKDDNFKDELENALLTSPITCGDSESIATVEEIKTDLKCKEVVVDSEEEIETLYPFPYDFNKIKLVGNDSGLIYMIHERCRKEGKSFPLTSYLFPIKKEGRVFSPSKVYIRNRVPIKIIEIEDKGKIIKQILN